MDKLGIFHANQTSIYLDLSTSVLCLSCFLVCSLQPCGHLLGKGCPLCSLVCDVFLCLCHFPMMCPESGVVLDCIDS